KVKIQKHLETSGLANASIGTGEFLENLQMRIPFGPLTGKSPLEKTDAGYVLHSLADRGAVCIHSWIGRDMGPAATALMSQYTTRSAEINGQTFVLGVARSSVEDYAAELSKGLGERIQIQYEGKLGIPALDDMLAFTNEFESYPGVEVPDPRLKRLGVTMGTAEEFARTVLRPRFE
ncbi:hypothetical protein HDZ31DRAFT_45941, partial [Schizophyllum fasciatum]